MGRGGYANPAKPLLVLDEKSVRRMRRHPKGPKHADRSGLAIPFDQFPTYVDGQLFASDPSSRADPRILSVYKSLESATTLGAANARG